MTLAEIITIIRLQLDDTKAPYGWSNEQLTSYLNEAVNELCSKFAMIEDSTTVSICSHPLLAGEHTITVSERVTGIERVELASTGRPLDVIVNVDEMDIQHPGWKTVDDSVPTKFIKDGLGNNLARVWPATLTADTVNLTVTRLPLRDMVWATDQNVAPEIPALYHDRIYEGILYRAYLKNDTDADNKRKAAEHFGMWQKIVEEMRRTHLHKGSVPYTAAPAAGWM